MSHYPIPRDCLWSKVESEDEAFDKANPGVYRAFVEMARIRKAESPDYYSARSLVHDLRHWTRTRDGSGRWRINNKHSRDLGKRLVREYPEFDGWIRFRDAVDNSGNPA